MGIPASIAIGAAGGAGTGVLFTRMFGLDAKAQAQFGSMTAAGGAIAGLATGLAARRLGPFTAAVAGSAAASLVPAAFWFADAHVNEGRDVLGAMLGVSTVGVAGGSLALLGAALLLRR